MGMLTLETSVGIIDSGSYGQIYDEKIHHQGASQRTKIGALYHLVLL